MKHSIRAAGLAALVIVALAACAPPASFEQADAAPPVDMEHIHSVGVGPGGAVYIATHNGIFTVPSTEDAPVAVADIGRPIGEITHDFMGFTISGETMYASGHPKPEDAAQVGGANLGLITSTDAVQSWQTLSLGGEVDFHDLAVVPGDPATIYGYSSGDGTVNASRDGGDTWVTSSQIELRDLAVDSDGVLYATSATGLLRSIDGGESFEVVEGAPELYLVDGFGEDGSLVGVALDQSIWMRGADGVWQQTGAAVGEVSAISAFGEATGSLVIADSRGILVSADRGETWRSLVVF